jgi:hypothetical protein
MTALMLLNLNVSYDRVDLQAVGLLLIWVINSISIVLPIDNPTCFLVGVILTEAHAPLVGADWVPVMCSISIAATAPRTHTDKDQVARDSSRQHASKVLMCYTRLEEIQRLQASSLFICCKIIKYCHKIVKCYRQ